MGQKLIWLLLCSFLFAQCCQCKSIKDPNSSSSEESKEDAKSKDSKSSESSEENKQIDSYQATVNLQFAEKGAGIVVKTSKLLQKLLADESVVKVKTPAMEEYKKDFTALLEMENKRMNYGEFLETIVGFTYVLDKLYKIEQPNAEQVVLELAAKKYGIDEIYTDRNNLYKEVFVALEKKTQEFLDSLTPVEREKNSKFANWFKMYKHEENIGKKAELFIEFLNKNYEA